MRPFHEDDEKDETRKRGRRAGVGSSTGGTDAALSDVSGVVFTEMADRLTVQSSAFEAAAGALLCRPGEMPVRPVLLLEVLMLYGRALDAARTLLTIARSHLALNAADGLANAARSRVARQVRRLDEVAAPLLRLLAQIDENEGAHGLTAEERPAWDAWRLEAEARGLGAGSTAGDPKSTEVVSKLVDAMSTDVFEPLLSLHTHLTSTMSVEVTTSEGAMRSQSFGMSVAVLKSSDDPVLRRSTFEAMNSWMASHASSFADLLNAVTGFRLQRAGAFGTEPLDELCLAAFRRERTPVDVFRAMMTAVDESLEVLRDAVRLRAGALGSGPMRVAHLLCPRPEERYSPGLSYEAMRDDWRRAFEPVAPGFADFVERAHGAGWINSQSVSMKAGGGWCDDLPSINAVRVMATFFPNRTGEAQLTHLLGVGWLHDVLHRCSAPERLVPLSVREVAGNVCETLLVRRLYDEEAQGDGGASILWLMLQRLSNLLLTVPARHRLLRNIYAERRYGILPAARLNEWSDESWRHYYGDATLETDRYVWVHKTHFYRHGTVFYDWQYSFGFLLSQLLAKRWRQWGATACGGRLEEVWADAGSMSTPELIRRHIGGDPRSVDFWREALEEAVWPVEAFRRLGGEE